MELRVGTVTIAVLATAIEPRVAVMAVVPATLAVTIPLSSLDATVESDELQVTKGPVVSQESRPENYCKQSYG
jgi:hypothetical protein